MGVHEVKPGEGEIRTRPSLTTVPTAGPKGRSVPRLRTNDSEMVAAAKFCITCVLNFTFPLTTNTEILPTDSALEMLVFTNLGWVEYLSIKCFKKSLQYRLLYCWGDQTSGYFRSGPELTCKMIFIGIVVWFLNIKVQQGLNTVFKSGIRCKSTYVFQNFSLFDDLTFFFSLQVGQSHK